MLDEEHKLTKAFGVMGRGEMGRGVSGRGV